MRFVTTINEGTPLHGIYARDDLKEIRALSQLEDRLVRTRIFFYSNLARTGVYLSRGDKG